MPYLDRIAKGQLRWPTTQGTNAGVVVLGGTAIDADDSIRGVADVALIGPDGSAISLAPLPDGPVFHVQVSASRDGASIYASGSRCGSGSLDRDTGRASCRPGGLWLGELDVEDGTWTTLAPPEDFPGGNDPTAALMGTATGLVLFTPESDAGSRATWTRSGEDRWTRIDDPPFGWPCQAGGAAVSFLSREHPPPNLDEVQSSGDKPPVQVTYQVSVLDESTGTWSKAENEAVEAATGSTSIGCTGHGLVALSRGEHTDVVSTYAPGKGWRTSSLPGDAEGRVVAADNTSLVLLTSGFASGLVFDPGSHDARPLDVIGHDVVTAHVLDDGTVIVVEGGERAAIKVLRG